MEITDQQDDPVVWNILDRAASLPVERREAFLDTSCAGDPERRAQVEALLAITIGPELFPTPKTSHRGESGSDEAVGTVVAGRYRLMGRVGIGGMGEVWAAEQTRPVRRRVALKLVKAGMDSGAVLSRFEVERQALAVMDHVNIAKVLDGGSTERGRPFFVMEYVEGVPITRYCDDARLSVRERLDLFVLVCQAVQHAHQKGIIHRDLKPSNILVCLHDGRPVPKVIDFGLAKATYQPLAEHTLHTAHGETMGTPLYMSPEQANWNNLDVDTRSDVYSLGVILYELLSGSTPLEKQRLKEAAWHEMMRLIKEEEPPRPSTRLSGGTILPAVAARRGVEPAKLPRLIRGDLDWIVMKALEKDRGRRYETAGAFAADVRRHLANEPVTARPPSRAYRLRKFIRRNKGPVSAGALVVLALVGGIVGTTWGMVRAAAAKAHAVSETQQKAAALRKAEDRLWWSLYERARAGRFSRQMGQRLDSLAALAEAARIRPDERLRDEAIAAMTLPDLRHVPAGPPLPVGGVVAYAGNRRLCARADAKGTISIRRLGDDREIRQIAAGPLAPGCCLNFSPDEQYLLGLGEGFTLRIWRVDDGQPVIRDEPHECWAHSFSPDGRRVAIGRNDQILFFDLPTGQEVARWHMPGRVCSLAFHPDGAKLAVGHTQSDIASVYDSASGNRLVDLPVGAMSEQVVAWRPDGDRLAVAGSDPRIQIWDVAAKRKVATLIGHASNVSVLTFHPDGDLLASQSWDATLRLWSPETGRPLLQLPLVIDGRPRFGIDGQWPAAGLQGEGAELLEVTPTPEYRTFVGSTGAGAGAYHFADFSPDGHLLAVGIDGGARVWDLRSGREQAALPSGTIFVCFDGNDALLTSGPAGLQRWPITSDESEGKRLRLGDPRRLSPLNRAWFARGPDGRTQVATTEEGGANHILDLKSDAVRRELGSQPDFAEVRAISGDGRWAATSGWWSNLVRLWDIDTGQMIREWDLGRRAYVFFSPDSRTLIISQDHEFGFWDLATLQPTLRLPREVAQFPGCAAFSPDGRLVALEMAPGVVHLKDSATGRTVARLIDPHGDRATWQAFTPDGTKLAVVAKFNSLVHIWDLRVIRARLKEMNLDWDWPEFPPPPPVHAKVTPN